MSLVSYHPEGTGLSVRAVALWIAGIAASVAVGWLFTSFLARWLGEDLSHALGRVALGSVWSVALIGSIVMPRVEEEDSTAARIRRPRVEAVFLLPWCLIYAGWGAYEIADLLNWIGPAAS